MKSVRAAFPLAFLMTLVISVVSLTAADADSGYAGVFRNLSAAEASMLERGELVIRPLKASDSLSLAREDIKAKEIVKRLRDLHPNYTVEFMAIVPIKNAAKTESTLNRIAEALSDVQGYVNIPYWSQRQKTSYALFDKMEVLDRKTARTGKAESIEVRQHMEPFDEFRTRYDYRLEAGALRFSAVNLDTIVYTYQHFRAVAPNNMAWELYIFLQEDRFYVYGIGAVKAFDLFGLFRDRLEPSLMGRAEAFFTYITQKISPLEGNE
ncbi:MAG: hypothetical protein SAMD01599839_14780 [Rectinema sp.]